MDRNANFLLENFHDLDYPSNSPALSRPAIQRGMDVGKELRRPTGEMSEEQRKMMFGQTGASVLRGL